MKIKKFVVSPYEDIDLKIVTYGPRIDYLHNPNGPAYFEIDDNYIIKAYYLKNKLHRIDGPSKSCDCGECTPQWDLHGHRWWGECEA